MAEITEGEILKRAVSENEINRFGGRSRMLIRHPRALKFIQKPRRLREIRKRRRY